MPTLKEVLEIFYLLSGPALVFIAYRALEQIKVSKEISRTNAKRESLILTAKECRNYAQNVIPFCNSFNEKVEKYDAKFFTKSKVTVSDDRIEVSYYKGNDDQALFPEELGEDIMNLINALSSFSNFFISGVADERIAYKSLGNTYCGIVKKLVPILVRIAEEHNEDNILKLFMIWHNRKEIENAQKEKEALERKINKQKEISISVIGA
ncbi:hypothetical protein AAFN46_20540 [Pseudomonas sp. CAU 1711]|uniref:hypothetical protein n=1 Tax=Pseudomonas sp. CAU 1711 TaxID=3140356 RepID=UPI0032607164